MIQRQNERRCIDELQHDTNHNSNCQSSDLNKSPSSIQSNVIVPRESIIIPANYYYSPSYSSPTQLKYMIIFSIYSFNLFFHSFPTVHIINPSSPHTHTTFHYICLFWLIPSSFFFYYKERY